MTGRPSPLPSRRSVLRSSLAGLPLLIAYVFFQRQIIRGIATIGLGGR